MPKRPLRPLRLAVFVQLYKYQSLGIESLPKPFSAHLLMFVRILRALVSKPVFVNLVTFPEYMFSVQYTLVVNIVTTKQLVLKWFEIDWAVIALH